MNAKKEKVVLKHIFKRAFTPFAMHHKVLLGLALTNLLIYTYCSAQIPIAINHLVNNVSHRLTVLSYFLFFILYFLISRITRELQLVIFGPLSQKFLKNLCLASFYHLSYQDWESQKSKNMGKLVQIITNGENSFVILVERMYYLILPLLLEIFFVVIALIQNFSIQYAFLFLGVVLIYLTTVIKLTSFVKPLHREALDESLKTRSKIHDFLKNHTLIKSYHIQEIVSLKLSQQLDQQILKFTTFFKKRSLMGILQSIPLVFGVGFLNYVALQDFQNGHMEIGFFAAINLFILQFIKPFEEMGLAVREIRFSLNNLYYYIRSTLPKMSHERIDAFNKPVSTLSLSNIDFKYADRPVFQNVFFSLKKGEKIAFIGKTGEGKTTLGKIISGFLPFHQGQMMINSVPIRSQEDIKAYKILYISQEILLFDDTIEFNLFLGKKGGKEKEMARLTQHFKEIFPLEDYQRSALTLSGGQKQLIALMRALAHKPDLIILDESNSSQDAESYRHIMEYLFQVPDTSVIFITHRLDMIERFDTAYLLNKGNLVHLSQGATDKTIKSLLSACT